MSRERKGHVEWVPPCKATSGGHYKARITLNCGARPWIHFDPSAHSPVAEQSARHKAEGWTERAQKQNLTAADFGLLTRAEREKQSAPAVPELEDAMTKWVELWIETKKARGQTSTRENESHYRMHIQPVLGSKHVRDWTIDDLRALCRKLDEKIVSKELSAKTAQNVWGSATRMCRDAYASKSDALRVRADNPAIGVAGPERGARKLKQYLFPSEFLRFIAHPRVPLRWKRIVTLAIYLYPRAGELEVMRWDDFDLEHGTVHIHRAIDRETGKEKPTKAKHARRFSIELALLPLLHAMKAEHEARDEKKLDDGASTVPAFTMPSHRDLSRGLKRWLLKAGVTRAELFTETETSKALTFHDLRATGVTWRVIRGDEDKKIQRAAGHKDGRTTDIYIREAEIVREGFGDVFPTLPETLTGVQSSAKTSRESSRTNENDETKLNSGGADGARTGTENADPSAMSRDRGGVVVPLPRHDRATKSANRGAVRTRRTNDETSSESSTVEIEARALRLARAVRAYLIADERELALQHVDMLVTALDPNARTDEPPSAIDLACPKLADMGA